MRSLDLNITIEIESAPVNPSETDPERSTVTRTSTVNEIPDDIPDSKVVLEYCRLVFKQIGEER